MNVWPTYTAACKRDVLALLDGRTLSAYRANPKVGVGPRDGSWAWRLERALEKLSGARYAVAVNSGTAALHCALAALDLRGREVITSPYTFSATASAILLAGGVPRFADVDPHSFCITPETVAPHVNRKTAAILPVDIFGYVADKSGFAKYGLPVVSDSCQAVGAHRLTRHEVAACYSMNGLKNVPAGEGGALVTNDKRIAERARMLANHRENFGSRDVGYNFRIQEMVACLAWHGVQSVEERNAERRAFANEVPPYTRGGHEGFTLSRIPYTARGHAYYCAPMQYDAREGPARPHLVRRLNRMGISCGEGYIRPTLEKYRAFKRYATRPLPVVTELSERTLVLFYEPWRGRAGGQAAAKAIEKAVR